MKIKLVVLATTILSVSACSTQELKDTITGSTASSVSSFILDRIEDRGDNKAQSIVRLLVKRYCKLPEDARDAIKEPYKDDEQKIVFQCD